MKKFLSGLPPLKIPSRAENEAIRKMLEGNWEPEDSPLSAFIDRPPPLPWNIENELREACAALLIDTGNAEKESTANEWFNFSNPSKSTRGHSRSRPEKKSEKRDESQRRQPVDDAEETDEGYVSGTEDLAENHHVKRDEVDIEPLPVDALKKINKSVEKLASDDFVKQANRKSLSHTPRTRPLSKLDNPYRKTMQLEPLNTAVAIPIQRPRTAPTSHSSNTSESAIASASTDAHPLSASTGITSVAISPAIKSHGTGLQPTSTSIPSRFSHENQPAQVSQKPSLEQTTKPLQQTKTIDTVESLKQAKTTTNQGFAASIKNFVRNRSRSISKSRDETPYSDRRASLGGALRNLSLRRNRSMGNLPLGNRSQANLDKAKVDEDAPPVPKLDAVIKEAEYIAPVHIVSLVRPQKQQAMPVTSMSLQPAKANIVEVQGRSPKTSLPKNELSPPEALRKHSLASSSIDSCFTPPVPQTPDKHPLPNHIAHVGTVRENGVAGHVDVLKAARSLESLRAQQQLHQQMQAVSSESPVSQFPRSGINPPPRRKLSHSSSRPTSRGTMKSVASVHSSRSPSRASRAISVSGQPVPLPPLTAKYSIIPNTNLNQHTRSPSQPSGLRHPVYAQNQISGISSVASSVVYLPSTNLGRPGTSGGESPVALRAHPPASMSKPDLSTLTTSHPASNYNSRRQTVASINMPTNHIAIHRANSNTSLATSTAGTINFSRKLAGNEENMKRESVMTNTDVTALPPLPVSTSKGGRLRRVLSSFNIRRPKIF